MKRATALLLAVALSVSAAVRGDKAEYLGGTVKEIAKETQGVLDLDDTQSMRFVHKGGTYVLPYAKITSLEFGQKVGRRVGAAMALGWIMLFSKKERHFLTVGFTEPSGANGAIIFELAKDTVQETLAVLQARSGRDIESTDSKAVERARQNIAPIAASRPTKAAEPIEDASITITSTPPGAELAVNGKTLGNTPATVKLSPGSQKIVVKKARYFDWGKTVDLTAGSSLTVQADMVPMQKESPSVITIKPR